jgi:hypothetical protein
MGPNPRHGGLVPRSELRNPALTERWPAMAEEKILSRVQKLLDKANAEGTTEEERQLLLDKADELMIKHAIDDAMLMATMSKDDRRKPVQDMFKAADPTAPHWEKFRTVLLYIANLHRVRSAFHYDGNVTLVGFFEDVEYVKMKWLNVYLHFSRTINPEWDIRLSPEQNAYNFHRSGTAWTEVEAIAKARGCNWNIKQLRAGYRRYCESIGEEATRMTQRNFAYKESFAEGFRTRICARINEMIEARDTMTSEAGALVAVKDLGIEVDEMFWDLFPHLRPMTAEERAARKAQKAAEEAAHLRWLESLSPEKRRAYDMEQERAARQAAKDDKRYWREQERRERALKDTDGARNGRASADQVDFDRNAGVANQARKEL